MTDIRLGSMVMEDSDGNGPAVVMIHGLGGSSNSFQTMMEPFADYRVLRPDLPGAGRSAPRPGRSGLVGLAVSVRDLLRAAQVNRAYLVGHSMGTLICQYLAAAEPRLVTGMTLFGPILEPTVAARQALSERAARARAEGMSGIAAIISTSSVAAASRRRNPVIEAFVRESLLRQDPGGYALQCEDLGQAPAADHRAIGCPTLLVAGENDPVAPVAMARQLATAIGGARVEVISGVGHWIMVEDPERSRALLCGHVEEIKY